MDRIMALRDQAMEAGLTNSNGARHAKVFTDIIGHSGWLHESLLAVKTVGMANLPALMSFLPVGLRALTHGKMPPLVHKNIKDVGEVRKLVRRLEEPDGE